MLKFSIYITLESLRCKSSQSQPCVFSLFDQPCLQPRETPIFPPCRASNEGTLRAIHLPGMGWSWPAIFQVTDTRNVRYTVTLHEKYAIMVNNGPYSKKHISPKHQSYPCHPQSYMPQVYISSVYPNFCWLNHPISNPMISWYPIWWRHTCWKLCSFCFVKVSSAFTFSSSSCSSATFCWATSYKRWPTHHRY